MLFRPEFDFQALPENVPGLRLVWVVQLLPGGDHHNHHYHHDFYEVDGADHDDEDDDVIIHLVKIKELSFTKAVWNQK